MEFLGWEVRDKITGFKGVCTSVFFDLTGCVQGMISPKAGKDNAIGRQYFFDTHRLEKIGTKPVMKAPTFTGEPVGSSFPIGQNHDPR